MPAESKKQASDQDGIKAAKIVLAIVAAATLVCFCCCGGVALYLAQHWTGDVEKVMIGEWGGQSSIFGYTRRMKLDENGRTKNT